MVFNFGFGFWDINFASNVAICGWDIREDTISELHSDFVQFCIHWVTHDISLYSDGDVAPPYKCKPVTLK